MYNKIFSFDRKLRKKFKVKLLAGVDEVGRGCLFGPIVAAAVVFDDTVFISSLKDSKLLSYQKRKEIFKEILNKAKDISCSILPVNIINKIGIKKANFLVMKNAVDKLRVKPELVIVDGIFNPYITGIKQYDLIKADKKSAAVAAASVVAKVIRDRIVELYHRFISCYDVFNNKGYATKKHIDAIIKIGVCELHRYYAYKFITNE